MVRRLRLVTAAASGIPILALGAWALPAQATSSSTPFSLSGIAAQSRQPSVATTPATAGTRFASANGAAASVSVGSNINVIGTNDVVQQATINGVSVYPAIRASTTAQNETTIAASGSTLVAGANDYRLYEPSENRYDGSGGFYLSTDWISMAAVAAATRWAGSSG